MNARCKVNGISEDFQLPYFDFVGQDPTIEEMKSIVCDKQIRPSCPNRWQSSEVRSVELFMRLVTSSVTRFGNFGKNLEIFGSIYNVYFIFGKVLNQF